MARRIRVEQLLGKKVCDLEGQPVGHIEELGVTWTNHGALVTEIRLGPPALLERVSAWFKAAPESVRIRWEQIDFSDPEHPRLRVPKDQLDLAAPTEIPKQKDEPDQLKP